MYTVNVVGGSRTNCHKIGVSYVEGGRDVDEQLVQLFNRPFGVDEQLVHFGVQMSQGPKVFGTQSPWDKTCESNCH